MKKKYLIALFICIPAITLFGQISPANQLQTLLNLAKQESVAKSIPLFSLSDSAAYRGTAFLPGNAPSSLKIDRQQLNRIADERPNLLAFSVPTGAGAVELELVAVDVFSPGSKLLLGTATGTVDAPLYRGVFYQGFIKGNSRSLVAISITDGELSGVIADETGNRVLSHLRKTQNSYLFYHDNTLTASRQFICNTVTDNLPALKSESAPTAQSISCKVVDVYLEVDYDLFTKNNSDVIQTSNYVANLFNQVALIYNRENIAIRIAGIKIWTVADPYVSLNTTGDVLTAFRANQNANPPAISNQLSHFMSGRGLGGGIAYLDVLCSTSFKYGVSASLSTSYSEFPNYSWEVMVVAHEMGHNFGSPHTQSCSWPGGALDNCYTTEGGCPPGPAPINGGTVMSYCHLTGYGINLANGFGTLPGNLIRSRVASNTCIPTATDAPASLGTKNVQPITITTYWISNSGSTQFTIQYRVTGTASWSTAGPFTGVRYTLTGLQPSTTYTWRVTGECSSSYSAEASFTTGVPAYCTPLYSNSGCIYDIGLNRVVMNGTVLSNNSSCAASYYTDYPTPVATLNKSIANPFTIELLGYYNPQHVAIWIDFDQNYEFDANERVFGTSSSITAPLTGSFTIPATVQPGVTYRMRVRNQYYSTVTAACDVLGYGETEDYRVYIDSGCPATPSITLSASAITCQQSATLAVTNCTGTVSWLPGNGSGSSLVVNPTQTTSYTATCTLPGCSLSQEAVVVVAPDMVSLQSGNWDNPGVWSCQRVPTSLTPVKISANHTVTMPASYTGYALTLSLFGKVNYLPASYLRLGLPESAALPGR